MKVSLKRGAAKTLLLFFLLATSFLVTIQCNAPALEDEARVLMNRAAAYLWRQQGPDGGWHSQTHGLLKSGQALTPFVLFNLLKTEHNLLETQSDAPQKYDERVERGLNFIRLFTTDEGVIGTANPLLLEYPNYATSYGIRVLAKYGSSRDSTQIYHMFTYLLGQQFNHSRSIENGHPAFGGWGFGEQTLPAGQVGYVDLSHTRRVLQALRITSSRDLSPFYKNAKQFLAGLQNRQLIGTLHEKLYDGGFHYSPVVFLANKGAVVQTSDDTIFLSYATATCDGLLALVASGVKKDEPAVRDALQWLAMHRNLTYPEGIPQEDTAQWHRVMFYYHLAVRAEVYSIFGWPDGAKSEMLNLLKNQERDDGSYVNELGAANKENDPLLATTMALSVLHYIVGGGELVRQRL